MNKIETGGPAFPTQEQRFPDGVLSQESEYGMTLRDYFAAKALPLAMADHRLVTCADIEPIADWSSKGDLSSIANKAYQLADAMLEARK